MPTIKQAETSQQTTIGASTAETTIVAADPNFRRNLCGLIITTLNGAVSTLTLRDANGAAVAKGIFDYPNAAVIPASPFVVNFDPPLQQDAKNTTWTIQASASATGYKVTAMFVTGD